MFYCPACGGRTRINKRYFEHRRRSCIMCRKTTLTKEIEVLPSESPLEYKPPQDRVAVRLNVEKLMRGERMGKATKYERV